MTTDDTREDFLIAARRGELSSDRARRLQLALEASRELQLLYDAGCGCDSEAQWMPGDEKRMERLVTFVMDRVDRESALGSQAKDTVPSQNPDETVLGIAPAEDQSGRARSRTSNTRTSTGRAAMPKAHRNATAQTVAGSAALGFLLAAAMASAWELALKPVLAGSVNQPESLAATPPSPTRSSHSQRPLLATTSVSPKRSPASAPSGSATPRTVVQVPGTRTNEPPPLSTIPGPRSTNAALLFAEANRARRAREVDQAIELYERLLREHPDSLEAADARIVLGKLRLEQDAPKAALRQFQESQSTQASAEALWGEALSLRKLQDPREHQVLRRIVTSFPHSPYARSAQRRLEQLSQIP